MSTFRVLSTNLGFMLGFALGKHTGSLYLVKKPPTVTRMGVGLALIGKYNIRVGHEYPISADEILPAGTIIELIV